MQADLEAPQTLQDARTVEAGLTSQEAQDRLVHYGPNDPAPAKGRSGIVELLLLFVNPLVIILLIAAALAGFLGQLVDAVIIIVMVLVGIAINFPDLPISARDWSGSVCHSSSSRLMGPEALLSVVNHKSCVTGVTEEPISSLY